MLTSGSFFFALTSIFQNDLRRVVFNSFLYILCQRDHCTLFKYIWTPDFLYALHLILFFFIFFVIMCIVFFCFYHSSIVRSFVRSLVCSFFGHFQFIQTTTLLTHHYLTNDRPATRTNAMRERMYYSDCLVERTH